MGRLYARKDEEGKGEEGRGGETGGRMRSGEGEDNPPG